MSTVNPRKDTRISGRNIYIDQKNRFILYTPRNKVAYYIPAQEAERYNLYKNRYFVSIALFMLLYALLNTWQLPVIISIVFFVILQIRYRRWLATLTSISNFKPTEKRNTIDGLVEEGNKNKQILLGMAYLILSILIIAYGISTNSDMTTLFIECIVSLFCLYFAIIHFIALYRINVRNQK